MAYIGLINERIIEPKTNPKPFKNQLKNNSEMSWKQYSFEEEPKDS